MRQAAVSRCENVPRSTLLNGLPLPNMMWSPTMENASSGVHSANKVPKDYLNKTEEKYVHKISFKQHMQYHF